MGLQYPAASRPVLPDIDSASKAIAEPGMQHARLHKATQSVAEHRDCQPGAERGARTGERDKRPSGQVGGMMRRLPRETLRGRITQL